MAQPIPETIGKYKLIKVLGQGGMGTVYQGHDPQLNRVVAIKTLAGGITDDPEFRERFYNEARATANLSHPNIVTVYDLGDHEGLPYLVMEYIEGHTLEYLISRKGPMSTGEKLGIVIDVCHGLHHAHQQRVVHRDIKPSNVMVTQDGTAKIVDFGIARMHDRNLTGNGMLIGTANFMSPEQLQNRTLDGRSDVFSTGILLYQLLTGHSPFETENVGSTLLAVLREEPPSFHRYLLEYPAELEAITFKALAKRPEDRYQTAADLAQDLSQLRGSKSLPHALRPKAAEPITSLPPQTSAKGSVTAILAKSEFPSQSPRRNGPISAIGPSQLASAPSAFTQAIAPPSTRVLALDAEAASEERAVGPTLPSDFTRVFDTAAPDVETGPTLPRVRLTFAGGNDGFLFGKSWVLNSVPFRIGRNSDLSIADAHLSREHAVIDWDGQAFTIADLGSKNGTYLDGRQLRKGSQILPFGAVIRLGAKTALMFSSDEIGELPDLTGQTIANRFQLTKVLRNGMKTALYEAKDSHLPQKVAVKILSPSLAAYPGYLEHFNREAEMAVGLRHPHICRVLDYGQTVVRIGKQPTVTVNYLSMELMEGGDLTERVGHGALFDLSQVVSWLKDISNALECAHRAGVTHGGLKLSSIVFDRSGEPYVTDFAMACRGDDQAKIVFVSSPDFLAPEQWGGAMPTPLADQYALAVLTYLLLAGSLPFEGQMDPKVRGRNFLRGPMPVHEEAARVSRPEVPPGVSGVLKRALSVEPASRYTSAREFFLALQQAVSKPTSRSDGPARIFISYQRDSSSGWAAHFASELNRKHQIAAFVDTQRMDSAVHFPTRLTEAIQDCDVFVCLLSGTTLQSKWVQEEIRMAWENEKPMVPVFQESYTRPHPAERVEPHIEALINYEGVKLFDRQNVYVENAIERLAEMVTESVRRPRRAPDK